MLPVPFVLERHFARHEFTAKTLLSSSDCDAVALDDVVAGFDEDVAARWRGLTLGYTESRGLPALREEIAADYQHVGADDVVEVVPEEGVLLALAALVAPGDRVIVMAPAYQSLAEVVRFQGGVVVPWRPRLVADQLRFDLDDLQLALLRGAGTGTALIVVNVPHNPTGAHLGPDDWARLFDLAGKAGARVFSDEMYRHLELTPRSALPSAVDVDDRAVVLSGLSKSLSAPGLRTGWLASRDRALLDRVAAMKDWTTICAPGPAELLALAVLRRRREFEAKNRAVVAANVEFVAGRVAHDRQRLTFFRPQAGSVALLRLNDVVDAATVCDRVLARHGALLVPVAGMFADAGDDFGACVRLGLGRAAFRDDFAAVYDALFS